MARLQSRINFGVFYDWVAKKGTTAGKEAVISMQKTSQGSVEPEKEHCWQIWNSIFWQIRPSCSVRNTLCLVQFGGRPYKSDRCGHNSEWKKILTSSPGTLAYGVIDLGVFLPLVIHLPSEKSILPKFSSLRGVAVSVSFPRKETECGLPWSQNGSNVPSAADQVKQYFPLWEISE